MTTTKPHILIIGAGAIGGFYGAILAKAGADVAVVCRSDYAIVKKHGYQINSDVLGNWLFTPSQILQSPTDYQGQADYVILCTKITSENNRVALLTPVASEKTSLVFIQNGVEIEQQLSNAFPEHNIISGLAFICCNRIAPGYIHHLAYGKLTLGNINPTQSTDKVVQLCRLIQQAGVEAITSPDIIGSRWLKCLWNAAFNPLSVLSDGLSTQQILLTQEPLIRTIMHEVSAIASATGHPLSPDSIDTHIAHTTTMPPYKTSMLLDFENQRSMETEVILGNTVRAAQRENIPCPTLNTLYALMKLKELRQESQRTG